MSEKVNKRDLLVNAEKAINEILKSYLPIKFVKSDLYLIDQSGYKKLLAIDLILLPHKKGTKKTNIYSIDSFINVINPKNTAFSYTLTPVLKRKQITDFSKIQLALARELEVSKNILNEDFDKYVENNDPSELTYNEKLDELNQKLQQEKDYYDSIINNPEKFKNNDKLKIASEPVLHGQIRYYYLNDSGEKTDEQKHLSSEKPNILVFDENSVSKKRKDNKIDTFLNNSIRIFGNVYMIKD
jgi:hypothetical protein